MKEQDALMLKRRASLLRLIINNPTHCPMNINMQSVPGSPASARGGGGECVFTALNAQTSSAAVFRLQPRGAATKASRACYLLLLIVTYSTPI